MGGNMIQKQAVDVSFAQGLDTKTDPKRVQVGKFVKLENTVFNKGGLLQKRNGFRKLTSLPDTTYSYLTTFNESLTAVGQNIAAFNTANDSWVQKGTLQPLSLSTVPILRNNLNQTACDSAVAANGLVCTAYLESNGSTTTNKYVIADSVTGQNIIAPAAIPVASGTVSGGMRVFVLANNFIIVFTNTITASPHLQYITINSNDPTVVSSNVDIASGYMPKTTLSWDGYVVGNSLFIAYNTTSGGQSIKVTYLTNTFASSGLSPTAVATFAAEIATMVSVTADLTDEINPVIWVSYYDLPAQVGKVLAVNQILATLKAPTSIIATTDVANITSAAQNGTVRIFAEIMNDYAGATGLPSDYIAAIDVTLSSVGSSYNVVRSVGLASKAFIINKVIYVLTAYESFYQPTYFLINGNTSTEDAPVVAAKLAYQNGGGYLSTGLPGVSVNGTTAKIAYLFKDLIQAVNKNTNVSTGTQVDGIYSQTGVNLATFAIGTSRLDTAEIGNNLHLTGGFLTMYDGYLPVEHNFFLYPDWPETDATDIAVWSAAGGNIHAQPDGSTNTDAYFYQFTYEWTDNQGNAFRSAPSIPIPVTTTSNGTTGSVTLNIPALRLTMKTANPVKLVIYRWSVAQQNYFQTTSITSPVLNDPSVDLITFVDTNSDATILGNNLIYTTGGVIEDINAPASDIMTLFDTRLWLVDAEDRNLLWFSKQVIEATPVEMSDLFTVYIPPTTATQGSTGPITSLAPMDDKLIIGKKNAFLYINGSGPDNTGANNQYSPPTFITATVGCDNQKSIVLIPQGLMFQSDKGIWLLDRSLNTSYIGSPVEDFTIGATVVSAVNVPETNQVRFVLDTGVTLMYDYFYGQWGSFTGISAISSCVFEQMHTIINSDGSVFQESAGTYQDGSNPVLMSFQTGPLRIGELQNYQRAYFFYLLGTYLSPHKMQVNMRYDYEPSPSQSLIITPTNYSTPYGSGSEQSPYGQGNPYGGGSHLQDWRVFLARQRCMAFSIEIHEIFDPSYGTAPGAGFTLSGLNIVMGFKSGFRPQPNVNTAG
jgi:hypothetical protein